MAFRGGQAEMALRRGSRVNNALPSQFWGAQTPSLAKQPDTKGQRGQCQDTGMEEKGGEWIGRNKQKFPAVRPRELDRNELSSKRACGPARLMICPGPATGISDSRTTPGNPAQGNFVAPSGTTNPLHFFPSIQNSEDRQ